MHAGNNDILDAALLACVCRYRMQQVQCNNGLCARILQLIGQLPFFVQRAAGYYDPAHLVYAIVRYMVLGTTRHKQRYRIPFLEA